jgi:ABC-type branched-subunit amino acid transport system ATPase component
VLSSELAWKLLRDMDFARIWRKEVRELSHGQRRFLEIAMAFLRNPDLLVLDEPAAGMASQERTALAMALREFAGLSGAVLLVEHHLDWIDEVADRVVVMNEGSTIWTGDPTEMRQASVVQDAFLGTSTVHG